MLPGVASAFYAAGRLFGWFQRTKGTIFASFARFSRRLLCARLARREFHVYFIVCAKKAFGDDRENLSAHLFDERNTGAAGPAVLLLNTSQA